MAYGYQRSMTEISHARMRATTTFFSRVAAASHLRGICVHAASGGPKTGLATLFSLPSASRFAM
ncbi:MAG: hypothetical protein DI595_17015 [Agrobacterium fabrum]|uniref:Uncharacterized protein n=1 Tax=Agrobacterium fabrum TaxID=1176649 RepID=A0A2W5F0S3_9HYPH|nr:MAG: hypothetical protein DI595_17015 [Agrobacterium fabrum]